MQRVFKITQVKDVKGKLRRKWDTALEMWEISNATLGNRFQPAEKNRNQKGTNLEDSTGKWLPRQPRWKKRETRTKETCGNFGAAGPDLRVNSMRNTSLDKQKTWKRLGYKSWRLVSELGKWVAREATLENQAWETSWNINQRHMGRNINERNGKRKKSSRGAF